MKTKSSTISPFVMLLVPALLAMLFTVSQAKPDVVHKEINTVSFLGVSAFKGLVETGLNCRIR